MHASKEASRVPPDHNASSLFLPDEAATLALGSALAIALEPQTVIFLEGDLGAGKTTLVRGMLRALGYSGKVKSPTYTLVELYAISRLNLYHFDFYRFEQPEEYLDAGLDEYFAGTGICLVEWPDKAGAYLPPADLRLRLTVVGEGRHIEFIAGSGVGQKCLTKLGPTIGIAPSFTPDATSSSLPAQR